MRTGRLPIGLVLLLVPLASAWLGGGGDKDRVRLEEVRAITLEPGKWTNARRVSAIPQMRCVGGSAGCRSDIQPRTVQCYNMGSDGYDVQWECKAEMDSAYKFGRLQVSCEGYDYPEDPYILRGSCGLEYELDLTAEGARQQHGGGGGYYSDGHHHQPYEGYQHRSSSSFSWSKLIMWVLLGTAIYWGLKFCFAGPRNAGGQNTGYTSGSTAYSSGAGATGSGGGGAGGGGPGFWSGAATGGLLGYFMGNRGGGYGGYGYGRRYGPSWGTGYTHRSPGYGWGSGWGGSGWGTSSGWSSRSSGRRSTGGSRTTSGFGGTSRR